MCRLTRATSHYNLALQAECPQEGHELPPWRTPPPLERQRYPRSTCPDRAPAHRAVQVQERNQQAAARGATALQQVKSSCMCTSAHACGCLPHSGTFSAECRLPRQPVGLSGLPGDQGSCHACGASGDLNLGSRASVAGAISDLTQQAQLSQHSQSKP